MNGDGHIIFRKRKKKHEMYYKLELYMYSIIVNTVYQIVIKIYTLLKRFQKVITKIQIQIPIFINIKTKQKTKIVEEPTV